MWWLQNRYRSRWPSFLRRRRTPSLVVVVLVLARSSPAATTLTDERDIIRNGKNDPSQRRTSSAPRCAPRHDATSNYVAGDVVSSMGSNFACGPFPRDGWCNNPAYAPGTGGSRDKTWAMAWLLVDAACVDDGGDEEDDADIDDIGEIAPLAAMQYHSANSNGNSNNGGNYSPCSPPYRPGGGRYRASDLVAVDGRNYECKPFPYTSWCGMAGYEPGSSSHWTMAWSDRGACGYSDDATVMVDFSEEDKDEVYVQQEEEQEEEAVVQGLRRPDDEEEDTLHTSYLLPPCAESFDTYRVYPKGEVASNVVTNRNRDHGRTKNFKCTITRWCHNPKFEPGKSHYWTMVWDDLGECSGGGGDDVGEEEEGGDPRPPPPSPRPAGRKPGRPNRPTRPNQVVNDVGASDSPCRPHWSINHQYVEGSEVSDSRGRVYVCKPYPYTGWCNLKQYEPGAGAHWRMAWDQRGFCEGYVGTDPPTPRPTRRTRPPTQGDGGGASPGGGGGGGNNKRPTHRNDPATVRRVFEILDAKSSAIDGNLFLYQGVEPSAVYRYAGFIDGLAVMVEDGVNRKHYYLGDDSPNGHLYGLVNIAAFIGQSMKETIQYDACDENSWDYYDSQYPLSNACGQLGQSYQDYHCPEHERHMECEVDPNMSIKGVTHAKWYGAPGPMFCGPREEYPHVGVWDYTYHCDNPWADPPESCEEYEGQKGGRYDNSEPVPNRNGRTDVEGCCWWGRGVIQTTGICNFGKLNYYLGKR